MIRSLGDSFVSPWYFTAPIRQRTGPTAVGQSSSVARSSPMRCSLAIVACHGTSLARGAEHNRDHVRMALVRSLLTSAGTTHESACTEAGIAVENGRRPRYERRSDPLSPSTAAASAAPVSMSPDASEKLTATPFETPSASSTPAGVPLPPTPPPAPIA